MSEREFYFGSDIESSFYEQGLYAPPNVERGQLAFESPSHAAERMDYDLKHEYLNVSNIRSQLSELSSFYGSLPEASLDSFLMRIGKWVSQKLYLCFEHDSENGIEYTYCMGSKRGNSVYCYRLGNRYNELLPLSSYPEFFEPEDKHKVQSSPLLFVSLTANPNKYSLSESWLNIRSMENNFLSALRSYLWYREREHVKASLTSEYLSSPYTIASMLLNSIVESESSRSARCKAKGKECSAPESWFSKRWCSSALNQYINNNVKSPKVSVICSVVEAQLSGYAHLHMVLLLSKPLKTFYRNGKWRCVNKREFEKYWEMGYSDIESCSSFKEAVEYIGKYTSKYFSNGFSAPSDIKELLSLSNEQRKALPEASKAQLKAFLTITMAILFNVRSVSFSPNLSELLGSNDMINMEMSNSNLEWKFVGIFFANFPKDWDCPLKNSSKLSFSWNDPDPPPFFYLILDLESMRLKSMRHKSRIQRLLETPVSMLSERDKRYIKKHSSEYFSSPSTLSASPNAPPESSEPISSHSIWGSEVELLYP